MKRILIIAICLIATFGVYGQDTDKNYIKTYIPRTELKDSLNGFDKYLVKQSVQYVDGLGRPLQSIARWASPGFKDIVSFSTYDEYGRQTKEFLPYESNQSDLSYVANPVADQNAFFNSFYGGNSGDYAFSESLLENSPLGRPLKQAAPGQVWNINGDHTVDMQYRHNTSTDNVRMMRVLSDGTISAVSDYPAGQLTVMITTDENDSTTNQGETREFSNKSGQVVLKQVKATATLFYNTYYVYDDYGNLRYVIPPEAYERIQAASQDWTLLNDAAFQQEWLFCYQYDGRKRMIAKRVPGSDWMYMVYDTKDRLILTQDGNQRQPQTEHVSGNRLVDRYVGKSYSRDANATVTLKEGFSFKFGSGRTFQVRKDSVEENSTWLFTKYDELGRPVATGFYFSDLDRSSLQTLANESPSQDEVYRGPTGNLEGYSNNAFPIVNSDDLLTVAYYDDYAHLQGSDPAVANVVVAGQITGSKTKVLGTATWLNTTSYYDNNYRPIKVVTDNHKGGTDVIENTYRNKVSSLISSSVSTHTSEDYTGSLVTVDSFYYDHMDRLMKHTQSVNGASPVTIAENTYNALGELVSKQIGNNVQQVDYEYNIRGWLTSINGGAALAGNDKFGMELQYDAAGQYNGNIGKMLWKSIGSANTNEDQQEFEYTYDRLSRLKTADYSSAGKVAGAYSVGGNDAGIAYDANGNILNLLRYKQPNGATQRYLIDDLTYSYDHGNQLSKVVDNGTGNSAEGFKDGTNTGNDYGYDANGNMIYDENKEITWIGYNHLNLPEEVQFANGDYVSYLYDAAGIKLQKEAKIGSNVKVSDYVTGKHYVDGNLDFFQHAEGRVTHNNGVFAYEYNLTDHLGNVRVTLAANGDVIQKDDYYPFGLTFNHWRNAPPENQYKYNGFEKQVEVGLFDYLARYYDPALGRFINIDPAADLMRRHSPYNYAFDNPIRFIDPDGMMPEESLEGPGGYGAELTYTLIDDDKNVHQIQLTQSWSISSKNDKGNNVIETITQTTTFTTTVNKEGPNDVSVNDKIVSTSAEYIQNENGGYEAKKAETTLSDNNYSSVADFKDNSSLGLSAITEDLFNFQGGLEASLSLNKEFNPYNGAASLTGNDAANVVGDATIGYGLELAGKAHPGFAAAGRGFAGGVLLGNAYRNSADHSGRSFTIASTTKSMKGNVEHRHSPFLR